MFRYQFLCTCKVFLFTLFYPYPTCKVLVGPCAIASYAGAFDILSLSPGRLCKCGNSDRYAFPCIDLPDVQRVKMNP